MHLAIFTNLYPPHVLGGYEILCEQVCRLLADRGHRLSILTSSHRNPAIPFERRTGNVRRWLRVFRDFSEKTGSDRWARATTAAFNHRRARAFLAIERPDLVFVWSQLRITVGAARAAIESGLPTVFTFNDEHPAGLLPAPFSCRPKGLANWILDRTLLFRASWGGLSLPWTTCISKLLKDNLVRAGLPISRSRVIYQGIPIEHFPRRERLFEPPVTAPRLLYAGQLHAYKGVHTLIEAAHRLASDPRFRQVCLDIVGDGPAEYRARLEAMAREGSAQIRFFGRLPHDRLPAVYRDHDIFIFPSIWQEPFGLTHLEAMASGTPVVSTADGGHGEFLADGENALIFPKEDAGGLAQRLALLLTSPGLAAGLADRARRMVEERFSLRRYVDDLERLLEDARAAGTTAGEAGR